MKNQIFPDSNSMYIVALAWTYVVFMMSVAEQSVVAGVLTFLMYGLLPVTIILYLAGSSRRRKRLRNMETLQSDTSHLQGEERRED